MIFEKKVVGAFRGMMHARVDDAGMTFYFSPSDFEGLRAFGYSFDSSLGHKLKGYFYCYDAPTPKRLVVFDHGFGAGHRAYMKEIELLCRRGYLVFSYDHTGCFESEGKDAGGLAQSLRDLCDCIGALKREEALSGYSFSVMGHSWGAFSAMNIAAFHPDVTHIVAISGFVSVEKIVGSFFGGIMKPYRRAVMRLERESNPELCDVNAVLSLKNSGAKALLIYSDNDKLCRKSPHYDILKKELSGCGNVKLLLTEGKGHNPNYTSDAVSYMAQFFAEQKKLLKRGLLKTEEEKKKLIEKYDWNRMTAQDEAVWAEIFAHLES
ncbi:MAG: alpha/beta fold hydrolase [Clostridia bacterium]|nr:alpha/beta fold hydrolase [Clostridia bacterium]